MRLSLHARRPLGGLFALAILFGVVSNGFSAPLRGHRPKSEKAAPSPTPTDSAAAKALRAYLDKARPEVADAIGQQVASYAADGHDDIGALTYQRLGQVLIALGDQATEKGVVGFVFLYGRLVEPPGDRFDAFLALFDLTTPAGKAVLNEYLDDSLIFIYDPKSALRDGGGSFPTPDYSGYAKPPTTQTLAAGTLIDRYGPPTGEFLAPPGTPSWALSLRPDKGFMNRYKVLQSFDVNTGRAAPWYAQAGGGVQYQLLNKQSVEDLIKAGKLELAPPLMP